MLFSRNNGLVELMRFQNQEITWHSFGTQRIGRNNEVVVLMERHMARFHFNFRSVPGGDSPIEMTAVLVAPFRG